MNEEFKTVPVVNQNNNNYIVVSDSESESDDEEAEENLFKDDINEEIKATPKTIINAKVVQAIKKLQLCITTMPTKSSNGTF